MHRNYHQREKMSGLDQWRSGAERGAPTNLPLPRAPEKTMKCPKCGTEVPPGKLVCDCFQAEADNETERYALERFRNGGVLYLRNKNGVAHLLPAVKFCLTLCRNERIKKPETRIFMGIDLKGPLGQGLCELCRRKAAEALKDAP